MIPKDPISETAYAHSWSFNRSARECFKQILNSIPEKNRSILLPAYIGYTKREGSGVFDPIRESKADYTFYELDKQLVPDHRSLMEKLETGRFGALLVIHYFGFCQADIESLTKYCQQHNILLIEDCAHTLGGSFNGKTLGTFGDYSFHSLHKVLPLKNGGLLKSNTQNINFEDQCDRKVLEVFSKSDIQKINQKRISNYTLLAKEVSKIQGVRLLYPNNLPNGITPHNLPILVENGLREKLYFKLIEEDVPVTALYYCMISEIEKTDFPNAHYVAENILNLPIHQEISEHNLKEMVEKIEKAIASL